jgi:hypothetical protein
MTYHEKLTEIHQRSIAKQKEFIEVVTILRNNHMSNTIDDEMYHKRDRLYREYTKDLESFKKLARYLEEKRIPLEDELDETLGII